MSESKRLMIAIPLEGRFIGQALDAYRRQVKTIIDEHGPPYVGWRPELAGDHITLRFVGDVPAGDGMQQLYDTVRAVVFRYPPLILALAERGAFPSNVPAPEVLWVDAGARSGGADTASSPGGGSRLVVKPEGAVCRSNSHVLDAADMLSMMGDMLPACIVAMTLKTSKYPSRIDRES